MDIISRLPAPLSTRLAETSSRITTLAGRKIDYAIAGVPFLSAATRELPLIIETAEMRREQVDQEPEPGEQSLQGWWLRSQDSWHHGAGAKFQESRRGVVSSNRFWDSKGIDPWEQGELRLLRRMVSSENLPSSATCVQVVGDKVYLAVGSEIHQANLGESTTTTLATLAGQTIHDLAVGRESWYGITAQGNVFTRPIAGGATKTWPLVNDDPVIPVPGRVAWAKHRLFATYGRRAYVVDVTAADATEVQPLYSHPTTDWVFTDIAEGPSCVYLAGYSDLESAIQRITLDSDGGIPQLSAGVTTAVLPRGERVQRIAVLAGTWIGIGTNQGFRVGAIDENGDIAYGPLFLAPEGVVETTAIATWGRWFYVAFRTEDARSVVYRVDVSAQPEEDGVFAWAPDVELDTPGCFVDLDVANDGRVVAAYEAGEYGNQSPAPFCFQHESELVEQGWIEFSQIRYRTVEPKLFKYVTLVTDPLRGSIVVDAVLPDGSTNRVRVYDRQGVPVPDRAPISPTLGPQRSLGFRFTLHRSASDPTAGPVIRGYSVQALPAVRPQRIMQVPLLCFDHERWVTGQMDGRDGWARDRLAMLHAIEDSGDLVLFQDLSEPGHTGRLVRIDNVRFVQHAPPHATEVGRGYGGIVILTLRTMD